MKMIMLLNREVKRVTLDFDWELHKVWKGYLNPHYKKCDACNHGETEAREKLGSIIAELIHSKVKGIEEVTFPLADKKPEEVSPFGLDALDRHHILLKILKLAGLPKKWGYCPVCKGEGVDPKVKEKYDNWKPYEPQKGEGYQCWETTSEGSPISPVFKTFDELCKWLSNHPRGVTKNMSKDDWKDALKDECPGIDIGTQKLVLPKKEKD